MKEMSLYYIFLLPSLAVNLVIHKNSLSYLFAKTFEKGYVVFFFVCFILTALSIQIVFNQI